MRTCVFLRTDIQQQGGRCSAYVQPRSAGTGSPARTRFRASTSSLSWRRQRRTSATLCRKKQNKSPAGVRRDLNGRRVTGWRLQNGRMALDLGIMAATKRLQNGYRARSVRSAGRHARRCARRDASSRGAEAESSPATACVRACGCECLCVRVSACVCECVRACE